MFILELFAHDISESEEISLIKKWVREGFNFNNGEKLKLFEYAIMRGHLHVISYLISELQLEVNSLLPAGNTALTLAVFNKNFLLVKYLVSLGADPLMPNDEGDFPIHMAAYKGQNNTLTYFVKDLKIDVDTCTQHPNKQTPFHIAAQYSKLKTMKCLISLGANPRRQAGVNVSVIHYAKKEKILSYLVNDLSLNINFGKTNNLYTPLEQAVRKNNLALVKLLVKYGADYTSINDSCEHQLLHYAADVDACHVIPYLVTDLQLPVDPLSTAGFSPFLFACERGSLNAAKILHSLGANAYALSKLGNSALHLASGCPTPEMINYLATTFNFDINSQNHSIYGDNPLHYALRSGNINMVFELLRLGADFNLPNKRGKFPLHIAAATGNNLMVKYLVENLNVPVDQLTKSLTKAKPALISAARHDKLHTVQILVAYYHDRGITLPEVLKKLKICLFSIRILVYFASLNPAYRLNYFQKAIHDKNVDLTLALYPEKNDDVLRAQFIEFFNNSQAIGCMLSAFKKEQYELILLALRLEGIVEDKYKEAYINLASSISSILNKTKTFYYEITAIQKSVELLVLLKYLNKSTSPGLMEKLPHDLFNHIWRFLTPSLMCTPPSKIKLILQQPHEEKSSYAEQRALFFNRLDTNIPSQMDDSHKRKLKMLT